jgi:hypothetical protein
MIWAGGRVRRSSKPWMLPGHLRDGPALSPCAYPFGSASSADRFRSFFRSFSLRVPQLADRTTHHQNVFRIGGGDVVSGPVVSGVVRAGVPISFALCGLTSSIRAIEVCLRTRHTTLDTRIQLLVWA